MSEQTLIELKEALRNYVEAAQAQKSDSPPDLKPIFARLDRAEKEALPVAPPQLRHYLESKSYRKAYDLLCHVTPERGSCER